MVFLQIYWELLSLVTFLLVHSNSKEVSYQAKLKFFLWTKLLENLLLAKYLISVALTLMLLFSSGQVQAIFYFHPQCLSTDNIMEKISFNILFIYPKMWHKLSQLAAFVWCEKLGTSLGFFLLLGRRSLWKN